MRPQWNARNDRDRKEMLEWAFEQIDDALAARMNEANANAPEYHDLALGWAEQRQMEPLRSLYPEIAKYINPPPRKPGERGAGDHANVDLAIEIADIVRAAWQEHYGKKNRTSGQASAEDIASAYLNIEVDTILARRKNYGRKVRKK